MHQKEEKEGAEHRQTGENEQTNKNQGKEWDVRLFATQELSVFFTFDRDSIHTLAVNIKGQISVGVDQRGSLGLY